MLRGGCLRDGLTKPFIRRGCFIARPTRASLICTRIPDLNRSFSRSHKSNNTITSCVDTKLLEEYKTSYDKEYTDRDFWLNPEKFLGQSISVNGFLGDRVDISQQLSFAPLYRSGTWSTPIQIVSRSKDNENIHEQFKALKPHGAVMVKATVSEKRQPKKAKSATDATTVEDQHKGRKKVELVLHDIDTLAHFPDDIVVSNDSQFKAAQRHLQLRFDKDLTRRLRSRQRLITCIRHLLRDALEVETPILFKSTPEGAREFLVPTRKAGYSYALPQSPQQYKQILMASGVGEYFQIARCFRDEDLRADRQPEFTQLDMELPFADGAAVMSRIEYLLEGVYTEFIELSQLAPRDFKLRRMTYQEAMSEHGVDKPDLRIKPLIKRVDHILPASLVGMMTSIKDPIIEAVKFSLADTPSETRNFIRRFMDLPEAEPFQKHVDGPPGVFIYDPTKPLEGLQAFGFEAVDAIHDLFTDSHALEPGDVLILQARPNVPHAGGSTTLGRLRTLLHKEAVRASLIEHDPRHHYLWITDFPMFTPSSATPNDPGQGGTSGFSATHHPFTAPKTAADVDLLFTDPLSATADHYDLVLNGVELGGGSRRIHNAQVQQHVMSNVLGMSEERVEDFSHLLECLRSGCPPHAGIALGLDRWCAVLSGVDSVRDVIAFPKAGTGEDLLVGSPTKMSEGQMATYHLKLDGEAE